MLPSAIRRAAALGLAAAVSLASAAAVAQEVTGAGATFPAPVYAKWADAYQKATKIKVNYQSIGSSGGLRQIRGKTVDFGASDMPLTPEELQKDGLIQFPTVIGGVVVVANLPGIQPGQLRITGPVLADIYLGKITKWNDKALADLNPGVTLPAQDIAVVRRADGSGTTFIFTNYLSKVSADWKSRAGEGTTVQWPVGLGGKGNEGVSAFVQRLPGSIGYVEFAYAKQNKLAWMQMQNADGQWVKADDLNFQAAAANADWNKAGFHAVLTQQKGKEAWPITGATFVLMHRVPGRAEQASQVMQFFNWAYQNGDAMATDLDYVPLPDPVVKLVVKQFGEVKDAAGKAIWTVQ